MAIDSAPRVAAQLSAEALAAAAHGGAARIATPSNDARPPKPEAPFDDHRRDEASLTPGARSPALSSSSTGASSAAPSVMPQKPKKRRMPRPQHAVERAVARTFYKVGLFVGHRPWTTIVGSVLIACALSCGLLNVTFEARSHKLYIPQKDFMAQDRLMLDDSFGVSPEPGILIIHRKDGGALDTKESMLAVLDLHERITSLSAKMSDGTNASYADVCYRRYIAMLGHDECLVSSPLELWWYQREQIEEDQDVKGTIDSAFESHAEDFGTRSGQIQALQIKYFFAPRGATDLDSKYAHYMEWETIIREQIFEVFDTDASLPMRVTYWSTNFNEEEAQSFVSKDSYLMALSLVFITMYVCITLGGVTADCRQTRLLLGSTCAVCTGLSMSSGFGIASMLGVPLQPISPIVCFTLLGVAVDDMIIMVMSFEAVDRHLPDAERLGQALSRAGSTITVTSVTSTVAFLTGYFVDFPALAFFCVPASLCILMVYFLQMTFFAACLSLDSKRAASARLDCCPCVVLTDDQVYRVPRMLGREPSNVQGNTGRERPLQICVNKHWARILLSNPMRAFVVVAFLSLVVASAVSIRSLTVGLPPRLSLPDGSPIIEFIDNLDHFWEGTQMQEVQLVLHGADLGDAKTTDAIARTVERLEALPFVLRFGQRWDERYVAWRNCTWAEIMKTGELGEGVTMKRFTADDTTCGVVDKPLAGQHDSSCVDDDDGFKRISGGKACALAATHCAKGTMGSRFVTAHCPATCGLCTPAGGRPAGSAPVSSALVVSKEGSPPPPIDARRGRFHHRRALLSFEDQAGETTGGREFAADVLAGPGEIATESRIWFFVRMSNDNAVAWTEFQRMTKILHLEPTLQASIYHFKYEFAYCDLMMPLFGLKNLVMAAGTIFLVVYLFLPFSIALLSTFTVVCIDLILLGMISAAGMSLNTITLVTLLLALALAIDYSCHIGHAYMVAPGRTRIEKTSNAIGDIGFSIINAAGSTLLGTLFLAASQSPVFRIFFLLIWSTIFLGLISGMAFVPVVLSFIGPLHLDDDEDECEADAVSCKHAVVPEKQMPRLELDPPRRAQGVAIGVGTHDHNGGAWLGSLCVGGDDDDEEFHTPKPVDHEGAKWAQNPPRTRMM